MEKRLNLTQKFVLTQSNLLLIIKVAVIPIATLTLFAQDLIIIFSDAFQSEITSYLLAIPALFTYLVYRKRKMLRAVIPLEFEEPKKTRHFPLIWGTLLSATAILLYWHGSYSFTPLEYHMLALPLFAAGLTLILFNPQTLRQLAFPIAFLIFLMPPPSEILYALGTTLSTVSAEASNTIVNTLGISSAIASEYDNPTIVITTLNGIPLTFTVDIACSGIYSLIGFLIFAVFIAYLIRDKTWKKLALILVGLPLIYLLNIIRITTILILGYYYGEDLALQAFHLLGGWILIFLGTLLLLTISEKIFKTQIFTKTRLNCPNCNPKPDPKEDFCTVCGILLKPSSFSTKKSDIAKIIAIAASVILLISVQAPVFALTQTSPAVIINTPSGQQISTNILPQISGYNLHFAYRDSEFEQQAKQDMSLVYIYSSQNESKEPIWVAIEIASTRSSLHRWETCLITYPLSHGYAPKVNQIELKDIKLNENPPIIGRYFTFTYTRTNQTQAVLYWYETATFTINQTSQQKNAKISVIAYPDSPEDLPNIELQLTNIAENIVKYWQPIKTWSQITMLISQNGLTVATVTTTVLAALTIFYLFEIHRQKKANTNAYHKLSEVNKQTADIVKETEKKCLIPTLISILETYREKTGKTITKTQLLKRLTEVEKTGIVKRTFTNNNDEPIVIWKTQIQLK